MKNFFFKAITTLHDICSSPPLQSNEQACLLVVSTTGLGDSLWGSPAIRALKKLYPNSDLTLLTSPVGEALFRENPYIDDICILKNPALPSCIGLLSHLRKKRFNTAFIFHISQRPILPFVHLLRPKKIIGTIGINKALDHYITHPIKNEQVHEIQRRLNIVGAPDAPVQMELFLTPEERKEAADFLSKQTFDQEPLFIGLHPGAKDKYKQWNPKYFITLGQKLTHEKKARILITGDKSEATLAESIANRIPGALSLAGKFPMRITAALIEKLHYFITNDTGPMHLAFALGTPTTVLFAPTDSKLCGPYKITNSQVIQKKPTCSPCIRKKCQAPFCMEQISAEEVFRKVSDELP